MSRQRRDIFCPAPAPYRGALSELRPAAGCTRCGNLDVQEMTIGGATSFVVNQDGAALYIDSLPG
jgi:hypothetical protein